MNTFFFFVPTKRQHFFSSFQCRIYIFPSFNIISETSTHTECLSEALLYLQQSRILLVEKASPKTFFLWRKCLVYLFFFHFNILLFKWNTNTCNNFFLDLTILWKQFSSFNFWVACSVNPFKSHSNTLHIGLIEYWKESSI